MVTIADFIVQYKEIFDDEKYDDPEPEFTNLINEFLQNNMKILFKKETYQEIKQHYDNVNTIYVHLYNETGLIELLYVMLENIDFDTGNLYCEWIFKHLREHYLETRNKNNLMRIIKTVGKNDKLQYFLLKVFGDEIFKLLDFLIEYYEHNNIQKFLVKSF